MAGSYSGREGLFSVRVEEDSDDALAVHATGELDIAGAPALEHSMPPWRAGHRRSSSISRA